MPKIVKLQESRRPRTTIGQMRQQIKILTYGDAPFGEYSLKRTEVEVATVRARVTNISGSSFRNGMALDANITHMVIVRKPEFALTTENMIEWVHTGTNEDLRIRQVRPVGRTSTDPRQQYIMMLCESQGLVDAFKDPSPEPTAATLVSLAIAGPATVQRDTSTQYTLTGTYSDTSTQDLTSVATWGDDNAVTTIVGGLLVTNGVTVDADISLFASYGGMVGTLPVAIRDVRSLASLAITGPSSVISGSSTQYSAIGTYTDASTEDLTSVATWGDNSALATIVGGLLVTDATLSDNDVALTADYGGVPTANATVTMSAVTLPQTNLIQHLETPTADGLTLQSSTGSLSDPKIMNVPCVDASANEHFGVGTCIVPTDNTEVHLDFELVAFPTENRYMAGVNGVPNSTRMFMGVEGATNLWRSIWGDDIVNGTAATLGRHTAILNRNGLWIDAVQVTSHPGATIGNPADFDYGVGLGAFRNGTDGSFTNGTLTIVYSAEFYESAALVSKLPCNETNGLPYDVIAGGVCDAMTASWKREDDIFSYNDRYGFRQTTAKVPSYLNGVSAADGNPLTNLAIGMANGSGTTTLQTDASLNNDPFWASGGNLIAKTQTEIEANNADTDSQRCVVKGVNILESILYSTAPTGADLAQLNSYIALKEA